MMGGNHTQAEGSDHSLPKDQCLSCSDPCHGCGHNWQRQPPLMVSFLLPSSPSIPFPSLPHPPNPSPGPHVSWLCPDLRRKALAFHSGGWLLKSQLLPVRFWKRGLSSYFQRHGSFLSSGPGGKAEVLLSGLLPPCWGASQSILGRPGLAHPHTPPLHLGLMFPS